MRHHHEYAEKRFLYSFQQPTGAFTVCVKL